MIKITTQLNTTKIINNLKWLKDDIDDITGSGAVIGRILKRINIIGVELTEYENSLKPTLDILVEYPVKVGSDVFISGTEGIVPASDGKYSLITQIRTLDGKISEIIEGENKND